MNDLASHIEYLLLRHDCVIVPGFGAFLAHRNSAVIDTSAGVILPPARTLGFNGDLKHNDGLLTGSVARREKLAYEAARMQVDKAVSSFMYQLRRSGTLPVGEMGTMTLSADGGTLIFEPDADYSLVNLPAYGLAPVALHPLEDERETAVEQPVITAPVTRRRNRIIWTAAASIALLCMLFGVAVNHPGFPTVDRHEYASIDTGLRQNVSKVMSTADEALDISREILLNIGRPTKSQSEEKTTEAAPVTPAHVATPAPGKYLLVVGSFPSQAAAARFMAGSEGLAVIEMDGNYRVYAASAPNIAEARTLYDTMTARYPDVWICRR